MSLQAQPFKQSALSVSLRVQNYYKLFKYASIFPIFKKKSALLMQIC
jgi:hypothetical protein